MTRCCGHRRCDVVFWCGTHAAYTYPGRIQSRSCSWLRIASTTSCGCNHSTMRVLSLPMKGRHICTQVLHASSRVSFIVYVTLAMCKVDAEVAILHLVCFSPSQAKCRGGRRDSDRIIKFLVVCVFMCVSFVCVFRFCVYVYFFFFLCACVCVFRSSLCICVCSFCVYFVVLCVLYFWCFFVCFVISLVSFFSMSVSFSFFLILCVFLFFFSERVPFFFCSECSPFCVCFSLFFFVCMWVYRSFVFGRVCVCLVSLICVCVFRSLCEFIFSVSVYFVFLCVFRFCVLLCVYFFVCFFLCIRVLTQRSNTLIYGCG